MGVQTIASVRDKSCLPAWKKHESRRGPAIRGSRFAAVRGRSRVAIRGSRFAGRGSRFAGRDSRVAIRGSRMDRDKYRSQYVSCVLHVLRPTAGMQGAGGAIPWCT